MFICILSHGERKTLRVSLIWFLRKMLEINKTAIGIAAGVAGTLFIGYCFYFDSKRRSDPEYRKKVRESKSLCFCRLETYVKLTHITGRQKNRKNGSNVRSGLPNLNDHEAIER